ncbi:MAG: Uncharacterized protein G01um101466_148 [Parcubacteria group bacterium Gr01-1014_66]|nr:MAG: Uncharacterized protein G01um101466_148 [Parcubacteria group bacterium Gr01-1014_66]
MLKKLARQIGTGGAIISPLAKKLVMQVLDSGRLSYGPFLKKFEQEFAHLHARQFAISANSGTSALLVAVQALKELGNWQDGDEILVPAITFIATSNVILQNRLKPVFVDVDLRTYNIDPADIEKRITSRTRALMPVHLFGLSAEMREIMRIARTHKLRVIEDSCETTGVAYRGRPVGSMGDIACFSTYIAHLINTGVGGMALTNDPKLAVKMRSLVNHGRDAIYIAPDDDRNRKGKLLKEVMDRRFSFVNVGHSFRLTEMEGALGLAELKTLSKNIKLRQRYAARLHRGIEPYAEFLQLPLIPPHTEHAFMMFPILVRDSRISRDDLTFHLEQWNIETRPIFPILNQPIYQKLFGNLEPKYPIASKLMRDGFFIGCHTEMTHDDVEYVLDVFKEFFSRV